MKIRYMLFVLCVCLLTLSVSHVEATPINLNDFFFFPGDPVVISADGSSATLSEDPFLASIILSNDPSFGDPGVFLPSDSASVSFHYDFTEGAGNTDEFFARLFDPVSFSTLTDNNGTPLSILADTSQSVTVSWNVLGVSYLDSIVGMEFQLNALDFGADSFVTIRNASVDPVPEPATIFLLGSGLLGFRAIQIRKKLGRK